MFSLHPLDTILAVRINYLSNKIFNHAVIPVPIQKNSLCLYFFDEHQSSLDFPFPLGDDIPIYHTSIICGDIFNSQLFDTIRILKLKANLPIGKSEAMKFLSKCM